MNELALTESPSLRAQYADRVEVLDKVKALRLLPDDMNATVEMVAEYYEVPIETIKSTVKNNRAELSRNGHRVLRGKDARSIIDLASLSPSISQLALFTRRAILNVGQLLRDSDVAEAVRTALLDAEERDAGLPQAPARKLSNRELAAMVIEEADRADRAEFRADVAEGKFKAIEAGDGLTLTAFHKKYFSEVTERTFFEHLYSRGYLIDQRGKGSEREDGTFRNGAEHRHPTFKGKPFFYLHGGGVHGNRRRENTRVRPGDPELLLKAALTKDGLRANEHKVGVLFAIEGGAS